VDGNVQAFQALDTQTILVLGQDGNLWLEFSPFGVNVPPARQQVDGGVRAFQALDIQTVLVLGTDGNLWLESSPFGASVPPARQQIDGSVQAFQVLDTQTVLVLGTDGNLWLESSPFGVNVPPARQQVDGSVQAFQALDTQTVLVLGGDRNLWLERARFGAPASLSFTPASFTVGRGLQGSVRVNISSVFPTDVTVSLSPANANIFLDALQPGTPAMVTIPRGDTSAPIRIVGVLSGNSSVTASAARFQRAVLPVIITG
jgi:hypothetical protein